MVQEVPHESERDDELKQRPTQSRDELAEESEEDVSRLVDPEIDGIDDVVASRIPEDNHPKNREQYRQPDHGAWREV